MSAVLNAPLIAPPWRQALPAMSVVLIALVVLYLPTAAAMVGIWHRSETFAHAFLVLPIILWLVWRRRQVIARLTPRPQPWVLTGLAVAAAGWLLGDMAGVNAPTQFMFVTLLVLSVPAMLGLAVARALTFPLAFAYFMVPAGEFLMPALMEATADFTVRALVFTGVPVYREGLQFTIPSGSWSVVEACSGVRYLIASFMVGSLFAYLNYRSPVRRVVFGLVSLLVPIVANWLRAYMIVMLGHVSGNTLAVGVDHLIYGWVFFGLVIGVMFVIGSRWAEPESEGLPAAAATRDQGQVSAPTYWVLAAAVVTASAWPQVAVWNVANAPTAPAPNLALPELPGLTSDPAVPPFTPTFKGAAAQAARTYVGTDAAVTVHVAYYRQQHYGHKLVSSENVLVPSNDHRWNHTRSGVTGIEVAGQRIEFRTAEVLGAAREGLQREHLQVRQVLWADGQFMASNHRATLVGVLGRLSGRGDDAAAITFHSVGEPAPAVALRLDDFVRKHLPAIEARLQAVRAAR